MERIECLPDSREKQKYLTPLSGIRGSQEADRNMVKYSAFLLTECRKL